MDVHELRDAGPGSGGKAQHLARLIAAGLPVPAGFVLDDAAFRLVVGELPSEGPDGLGHALETIARRIAEASIPAALERAVAEQVRELGARVVVRSSATIEDGEAGAAAGVFSSRAVPIAELWLAIRAVWTSALTPLAAAYARRRGQAIAIGVIVQREVAGELVAVYTRPPGAPAKDEVLIQRGGQLARHERGAVLVPPPDLHAIALAVRAEHAIEASAGADVELVQLSRVDDHGTVAIDTWVVQARPIVHPKPRAHAPPPPIVVAALADGRVWTWDITHNPDPLSPAQAGLVERVERAGLGPYMLRICAGYLYTSPRESPQPPAIASAAELVERASALETRLSAIVDQPPKDLADALARYLAFYAVWAGELSPLVAAARRSAPRPGVRASSVEATLAAAAHGELSFADVEARLGDLAPSWDVASAPFGERPGLLRDAIANAEPRPRRVAVSDDLAGVASDLAERDDLLFARAQAMVRRALLARASELGISRDDVCWLPLDDVVAGADLDAETAHARASGARAAAHRAAVWDMPLVIGGASSDAHHATLHGVGSGPRVVGRVVRFASLAAAAFVGAGDVVVVRAVTPALAVFIGRCAALVSETGGLLDHGAALARELGIPCVVGCRDAWTRLTDGMVVAVDGDAGEITTITV